MVSFFEGIIESLEKVGGAGIVFTGVLAGDVFLTGTAGTISFLVGLLILISGLGTTHNREKKIRIKDRDNM